MHKQKIRTPTSKILMSESYLPMSGTEPNEKGDIVMDVENIGTKNYGADPVSLDHLFRDVLPYQLFSNSPNDKTPLIDRVAGPEVGNQVRNFIEQVQKEFEKNISGMRKVLNDFYKLKIR